MTRAKTSDESCGPTMVRALKYARSESNTKILAALDAVKPVSSDRAGEVCISAWLDHRVRRAFCHKVPRAKRLLKGLGPEEQ